MPDIKLPRLPARTPVKVTLFLLPDLHEKLEQYASLYRETYRQTEGIAELIPAMLINFLESDRAFARVRRTGGGNSRDA